MDSFTTTHPRRVPLWPSIFLLYLFSYHAHGKFLWAESPAVSTDIIRSAYPIGNGHLAVMPFGVAGAETLNLNIDSLWSGGPFEAAVSKKSASVHVMILSTDY